MSVIWLDQPPYVMNNTCPDCWPNCSECPKCDCCCICETCHEERREMEDGDAQG